MATRTLSDMLHTDENDLDIIPISITDARYPRMLREIHSKPAQLYCRGNLDLLDTPSLGIVGTRKITAYGRQATEHLASGLVRAGVTVVSGLAMGVDAVAHRTVIDAGGQTIAVLGCGVDDATISPRTNLGLARDILRRGGLIVSEYPAGQPAASFTFPARNRIISGLCRGVAVVEADRESGALITAKFALDQNRDVFAVPGPIFSPRSAGTNALIQRGAKLVLSAQDILDEYPEYDTGEHAPTAPHIELNPHEQSIVTVLTDRGPTFVDDIVRATDQETHVVLATLSLLEIKGVVQDIGNRTFQITTG